MIILLTIFKIKRPVFSLKKAQTFMSDKPYYFNMLWERCFHGHYSDQKFMNVKIYAIGLLNY